MVVAVVVVVVDTPVSESYSANESPHMTVRRPMKSSSSCRVVASSPRSPPHKQSSSSMSGGSGSNLRNRLFRHKCWETPTTVTTTAKKRVTFGQTVKAMRIPSMENYTQQDRMELYHTMEEFKAIRKRIFYEMKILRARNHNSYHDDDDDDNSRFSRRTEGEDKDDIYCERGLEGEITKEARMERKDRQEACRKCVLQEQEYQRSSCSNCQQQRSRNRIAQLCAIMSCESVHLALELAKADAKEAREYLFALPRFP